MEILTNYAQKTQLAGPGRSKVRDQMQAEGLTAKGCLSPEANIIMEKHQ